MLTLLVILVQRRLIAFHAWRHWIIIVTQTCQDLFIFFGQGLAFLQWAEKNGISMSLVHTGCFGTTGMGQLASWLWQSGCVEMAMASWLQ